MNKVDLCAQANAGVSGWISVAAEPADIGRAARVHQGLLNLVRDSGPTRRQTQALKPALIRHINAESRAVVKEALDLATKLQDARFGMEVEDSSGKLSWAMLKGSQVPPASDAPAVLRLATAMHEQKVKRQSAAMRAFEHQAQLTAAEVDLFSAHLEGTTPDSTTSSPAIESRKKRFKKELAGLSAHGRSLVLSDSYWVPSTTWFAWALPVELAIASGDQEVREAAKWYEQLRAAMYRPLPVDETASKPLLRLWKRQWAAYEDCGSAFGVIAVWLRCMTSSPGGQRCEVCYRHLGKGLQRFCTDHRRTATERQDARDLHISDLYRPLAERLVRTRPEVQKNLSTWSLPPEVVRAMLQQARRSGISPDLAMPAASLAAALRELFPALTPSVRDLLERRFGQLFAIAQAPFERTGARSREDWQAITVQQHEARHWLRWETLFKVLFGPSAPVPWCTDRTVGDGLDRDHPLAAGTIVPSNRLARDLMHMGAWREVDERFDRFAYLDLAELSRLRRRTPGAGQPGMSLADMAAVVGASPEAVRQTLRFADGQGTRNDRRDRIIPAGIRRLQRHLADGF